MSHPWECKKVIEWTTRQLVNDDNDDDDDTTTTTPTTTNIQVSNPNVVLPANLSCHYDFMTEQDAANLVNELKERGNWTWKGFVQKRNVQEYSIDDDDVPPGLVTLVTKCTTVLQLKPTHITVEEFPTHQPATRSTTHSVVTRFECPKPHDDNDNDNHHSYFVAHIPLTNNRAAVQHMNRPKKRLAECWKLYSNNHWMDLYMAPRSLTIKQGEALWDWRVRLSVCGNASSNDESDESGNSSTDTDTPVMVVKLSHLPPEDDTDGLPEPAATTSIPRNDLPMPPLHEILTIVVTTSPIQSHPSTEVMERTFDTFQLGGGLDFCKCRKVIVCDGVRILDDDTNNKSKANTVSRKHANVKQALRNGIATTDQLTNYQEFKRRLRQLCQDADCDSPFSNTVVEELSTRHGYGFALSHALKECVTTPYCCVIQHDRTFMRPTPIQEALHTMWVQPDKIKYIGFSMRSNLIYRDIFMSKYGKNAFDDLTTMILRPPELLVSADDFGPGSRSVQRVTVPTDRLRANLDSVAFTYQGSAQYELEHDTVHANRNSGLHQMTLTPTLFWYDNTHVVETAHYRDFIFHPRYNMVARGGFVEDKTSPVLVKSVERLGLAAGHAKFGCYLLDDHSGYFFTGHLDGGSYLNQAERERKYMKGRVG